jgi:nicotinamidase-related amidase
VLAEKGIVSGEWTILVTGVSAATCAHVAALGFSNRHYMTLIPLDCTAATIEAEARTYAQYMHGGYSYNMDFTTSKLVEFAPVAVAGELVGATA